MAFSAMHSARRSGNRKFISTGHSVPGVIWKRMSTPSSVSSWPVWVISSVGGISPTVPTEVVWPSPAPIWPAGPFGSLAPYMYSRTAAHGAARVDVLGDRRVHEAVPGDDRDALAVDAVHPAEVVDVRVGVDDRGDRPVAAVLAVERQRGGRGLLGDQRVDDDDAVVALDQRHVRQVETADLVDAVGDLVEPLLRAQLALAPQARVRGVGAVGVEEGVGVVVPDHAPVGGLDDARAPATRSGRGRRPRSRWCRRRGRSSSGHHAARPGGGGRAGTPGGGDPGAPADQVGSAGEPMVTGLSAADSSSVKSRDRMRKRTPSGASSENPAPRPGTTSSVRWVCFQYSNCGPLM